MGESPCLLHLAPTATATHTLATAATAHTAATVASTALATTAAGMELPPLLPPPPMAMATHTRAMVLATTAAGTELPPPHTAMATHMLPAHTPAMATATHMLATIRLLRRPSVRLAIEVC